MKFADFEYMRPDMQELENRMGELIQRLEQQSNARNQASVMQEIHHIRTEYESTCEIAYIRYTMDTTDPVYKEEMDYINETKPLYQHLISQYYRALTASPYRSELESQWGKQLFRIAEMSLSTFSPDVMPLLQEENKLCSEFTALQAAARISFDEKELNLSQLIPFTLAEDRQTRKRAHEARTAFLEQHEAELDHIFDRLVKVRTEIAHRLGFRSFVELGYVRMNRTDYSVEDVARFRRQVLESIVPVTMKLKERQRKRLGLPSLKYYDDAFSFPTGKAKPKGDPAAIVANSMTMFAEMSSEPNAMFAKMIEQDCTDLLSKQGKAGGGYCAMIAKYETPFIFANFNGTPSDIDVITHEAGHALQAACCLKYKVPEYIFPTAEACEIHSMSMEFFAWPWMHLFFEEEAGKYRFDHMSDALYFLPNGAAYDEFQHYVYEHPDASPEERKRSWREIEKRYVPYRNYDDNDFLEKGNLWLQNGHVFGLPFYYVDYALARICAFQLWQRANEDRAAAWSDYMAICDAGGSRSFTELLGVVDLVSPFTEGCVAHITAHIEAWLDDIDDSTL